MKISRSSFRIFCIALFLLGGSLQSGRASLINIWVVSSQGSNDSIVGFLDRYTNVGTVTAGSFTGGAPSGLTANDLVIVSRNTNSADYATNLAEIDSWNSLEANVLLMSAFLSRSSRWDWTDTDGVSGASSGGNETAVNPANQSDPLFQGVTFSSNQADLYNAATTGGQVDAIPNAAVGGGSILATGVSGNQILVARWSKGDALVSPSGSQTVHGGNRIFLANDSGGNLNNFNPDGLLVLNNALNSFGLVPEPSTALLLLFSFCAGLFNHRKKRKVSA